MKALKALLFVLWIVLVGIRLPRSAGWRRTIFLNEPARRGQQADSALTEGSSAVQAQPAQTLGTRHSGPDTAA